MTHIGVLVSGEGTNLQALIDADLPIVAVASNRPGARALERARDAEIPTGVFVEETFRSRCERDAAMADWLESVGVDLVVCAGYMHLLTPAFLERFPQRVLNVHPSLLPDFPGTRPVEDALAAGVEVTGVTVHLVDHGVDSGPVVAQEAVRIRAGDTPQSLLERLHEVEHRLLPETVRGFPDAG